MALLDAVQAVVDAVPRDADRAVRVVDALLHEALAHEASDLHLESRRDGLLAKMRLDGRMHVAAWLGLELRDPVLTRLKVMARLVIYQSLAPQDGRFEVQWDGAPTDCRVAFLPTLHGEKVVVRLHTRRRATMALGDLGMSAGLQERVGALLQQSQGAIFLTGPSSSGKTTTIYAMLRELGRLRGDAANIVTLEDPIEADLETVSQTQVRPDQGMTFDQGLRTLLRQDPDVIMVGEVRDAPTAAIAVQAALTGHLVISTVHSGRASGVFARLLNMGIEPFLVASAVRAVVAQRLVRRLCPECRVERMAGNTGTEDSGTGSAQTAGPGNSGTGSARHLGPCLSPNYLPALLAGVARWWEPAGCPACDGMGFRGRTGLFELLENDEGVSDLVLARAPESRIRAYMEGSLEQENSGTENSRSPHSVWTLPRDGAAKVAEGVTAPSEVLAVLA
jgi:general secretion pathway protein E